MKKPAPPWAARRPGGTMPAAVACMLLLVPALQTARAAQDIRVREGDTAIVRISSRDPTRIRVAAGRVLEVIGDVHDAERNPGGRIMVLKDEADGEVYLRPVAQAARASASAALPPPVKLDLKTDRGTIGLLLQPADSIGETLVLNVSGSVPRGADAGRAESHQRTLKALTLVLLDREPPTALVASWTPVNRQVSLWAEARFMLLGRVEIASHVGERYELTNVGTAAMVLDERELFAAGVQAVAIVRHVLAPGESTWVAVIREAGEP